MDEESLGILGVLFGGVFMLIWFAMIAVLIASLWKIYTKAGQPGWAAIVPIYNIIILMNIVGRPVWWVVLFCIPFVNFIAIIIIYIDLAKSFGKDIGFAIGMIFLFFIFMPMLAFGDAKYMGPSVAAPSPQAA
jgi:hypothetical protein